MRENVIIAYRGANYELGQWPQGYGIWSARTEQSQPNEWWPPTPEGWSAAWYRFVAIEAPGTIAPVREQAAVPGGLPGAASASQHYDAGAQAYGPPGAPYATAGHPYGAPGYPAYAAGGQGYANPAGQPSATALFRPSPRAGLALLIFGIVCGVISLFPSYTAGTSLASQPVELVPHAIYLATWAAAAVLIGLGGIRRRIGALLGLGVSVVTFGFFLADVGIPMAQGAHLTGAGLVLGGIGWLACAAGSWLAFGPWPADWPEKPRGSGIALATTLIVAGVGAAITFAPSWDRFVVNTPTGPHTLTAGNAFANPAPIIAGNVAVMLAVVAVLVIAALWRPARMGWALAAGAIIPLVAQLISAVIQVGEPALTQLGISKSAAAQAGVTATAGLTAVFWVYCAFVIVLVAACAWRAARPDQAMRVLGGPAYAGGGTPVGQSTPGAAVADSQAPGSYQVPTGHQVPGAMTASSATPSTSPPQQGVPDSTGS